MRFRLSPEWQVLKNPIPTPSHSHPTSHSCEGRNLRAEGGNCKEVQFPAALRRWRFLLSQEWN
ncbi:MAG: hypothetical protein ACR2QC_07215 [Gammaproteobacteria bacterium]